MWIRPACIMCNTQYGFLVWMILLNYVDVIAISYNDIPVSQACRIHLLYLKMEKLPLLLFFLEHHAFDFFLSFIFSRKQYSYVLSVLLYQLTSCVCVCVCVCLCI